MRRFSSQIGVREEPEKSETVVHRDYDDVMLNQRLAARALIRRASEVATARDPHHDGLPLATGVHRGRPDIQEETILPSNLLRVANQVGILRARRTVRGRVAHVTPRLDRQRLTPSQRTYGRSRVTNSEEGRSAASEARTSNLATRHRNDRPGCRRSDLSAKRGEWPGKYQRQSDYMIAHDVSDGSGSTTPATAIMLQRALGRGGQTNVSRRIPRTPIST